MRRRSGPFWDGVEGRAPIPPAAATLGFESVQSTLQLNVSFLRPFDRAGSSKGRVVQRDGDLAFLEASLLDGDAAVIATATATEWPDGSHVESLMEISLQWLDGRTLLTLTQRGVPYGDVERGFTEGWNEFLDGLVARIQTRPAT
jgi:hypothetical protein